MTRTATRQAPEELERPRRLTLSQIVEMLLTRAAPRSSSVTLTRNMRGETQIEVTVHAGAEEGIETLELAEARAAEVYAHLAELYPPPAPEDSAAVELTRNAKGETQISVDVKTSATIPTLDAALEAATAAYTSARGRYPLSDGTVGGKGTAKDA